MARGVEGEKRRRKGEKQKRRGRKEERRRGVRGGAKGQMVRCVRVGMGGDGLGSLGNRRLICGGWWGRWRRELWGVVA